MPSLVAGYAPAEIPPPGPESVGLVADDDMTPLPGPARTDHNVALIMDDRLTMARMFAPPAAPELRVPGVERAEGYIPAGATMFTRNPGDFGNDELVTNRHGIHVAQTAGASVADGQMEAEPPMYGATWRLEPQPASAGWYVEG